MVDEIFTILSYAIRFYIYAVIIYILMSWFPGARESSFGRILSRIVEPYLEPFRKIIPPIGMIDISPIVAILALELAQRGLAQLFFMLFY